MKRFFFIAFLLISIAGVTKERCIRCERDSLRVLLRAATTENQKLELLREILNTKLTNSLNDDDSTKKELGDYISLGERTKTSDLEAYRSWKEGYEAFVNHDFKTALEKYKRSVDLFDTRKAKIGVIISQIRNIYTELHQQEEKFKFYSKKVKQYQVDGPIENLGSAYHGLANYYNIQAEYGLAISNYLKAGDIFKNKFPSAYRNALSVVAGVYFKWGNEEKGMYYAYEATRAAKPVKDSITVSQNYSALSDHAVRKKEYFKALAFSDSSTHWRKTRGISQLRFNLRKAMILIGLNEPLKALPLLIKTKHDADSMKVNFTTNLGSIEVDYGYYKYHISQHDIMDAEKYLLEAYRKAIESQANNEQRDYLKELSQFYANRKQFDKAYLYNLKFISLAHSLDSTNNRFKISPYEIEKKELQQLDSIHVLQQTQAVQAATIKQSSIMLWISLGAILIISASMSFVYRQYRTNKKTLQALQNTQQQLVLAEKMASLGELTAGIAHEIQNPLNFVNNFSEVSNELIQELKVEKLKVNSERDEKLEDELLNDISQNLEKINHHGKRADAIVKSMLQHSRKSTNQKELTDVNALCDEFMRLSYHGLRAKEKSFNAKFETDFDPTLPKVNVIPQDIGRVLLNLLNNAFYAVAEKQKQGSEKFEPTVIVSTRKSENGITIRVSDNGGGIPLPVLNKIFQPFFTTKPTGEGTGLGLSLSYDIVKAHGGELKAETKEGTGTDFIISLPNRS